MLELWSVFICTGPSRLVGRSFRRQVAVRNRCPAVIRHLPVYTCRCKAPFRCFHAASCLNRILRRFPVSCNACTDCSMVCTQIPFARRRRNIYRHECRNNCRNGVVWSSVRLWFRRRLAVRLLRVRYYGFSLLRRLVSSCLWLSPNAPTYFENRARILGKGDWYRGNGYTTANSMAKNAHFHASVGVGCCVLCCCLDLLYGHDLHSTIHAWCFRIRHNKERHAFRRSVRGIGFVDPIQLARWLVAISRQTVH